MSVFDIPLVLLSPFKPLPDKPTLIIQVSEKTVARINRDIAIAIQGIEAEEKQALAQQKYIWSD